MGKSPILEDLFDAAAAIRDRDQRLAFVARECGENAKLETEVLALLDAHEQAGGFLKTIENSLTPETLTEVHEGPGTVIGHYKLLQKIGEGGFGVVYMAEQEEPVRRRVALKIIKLGMDTRQVIARFEAERQALAMMDHPNIARVFDAGSTESGRPYFVMELVRGLALTTFCDRENLTTSERLDLFIDVCQAIQHAHLKGIIHRDIKPTNVMVTLHDGKAVPKVIDFGIAKATRQRLTEKTLFTRYQQFIGTPAYMSPEQAEMSGLDVDTRTDVYALGVMLYELLVGQTPFDSTELASAGYDEIRRRIREDEPIKPSTRLQTLEIKDQTDIARHRGTGPAGLSRMIQGDLDWIVMTAMEKDRRRRYESPGLLARDLERYANNEAVVARPPTRAYRLSKTFHRHRLACLTGALTLTSLITGIAFLTYGLMAASKGRNKAEASLSLARLKTDEALAEKNRADEEAARVQSLLYPSLLTAASEAARDGRRSRALELLNLCPESERGWEWQRVAGLLTPPTRTFAGHETHCCVNDLQFDPHQPRLATAGGDGRVHLWDTLTGKRLSTFQGHRGPVFHAAFFKGGKTLCTLGGDQTLRVVEAATGRELSLSENTDRTIVAAALSVHGERVVTSNQIGEIRLWSQEARNEMALMDRPVHDLAGLAISPDATRIAAATSSGALFVWSEAGALVFE
ncbi:MAG: serine/threonine-protein kinase, partial [Verrucomicrobiota bacterium]